jgi:hypothetical protein
MGLTDWRERRRATATFGTGVWRLTADRLARGLRSYESMAQGTEPGPARDQLEDDFGLLSAAVADGRAACAAAQLGAPSSGLDVPAGPDGAHSAVHQRLTRLGAEIAAAAEGAALVRVGDVSALQRVHSRSVRARAEATAVREAAEGAVRG